MPADLAPLQAGLLAAAAFLAGALNAVAGGGTFLTMPVLVVAGALAPLAASATSTAALLPGYLATAAALRHGLQPLPGLATGALLLVCAAGGSLGAALLLVTPAGAFASVLPWLVLFASALFALAPWLFRRLQERQGTGARTTAAGVLVASLYGGYFNGGLGVVLLATLGVVSGRDAKALNGHKALLSAVLTAIAVGLYAAGGAVAWELALPMMLASALGGWAGARLVRRLPAQVLRAAVVLSGAATAAWFFGLNRA